VIPTGSNGAFVFIPKTLWFSSNAGIRQDGARQEAGIRATAANNNCKLHRRLRTCSPTHTIISLAMKVSITAFVALALASSSLATPSVKRHGPGKRGLVWPWYNGGLDPGRLNDGQGTVNLMCALSLTFCLHFKICRTVTIMRPLPLALPTETEVLLLLECSAAWIASPPPFLNLRHANSSSDSLQFSL
jgi:hypothetical protein